MQTTVMPSSASVRNSCIICRSVPWSKPLVTSSRNSTAGRLSSSMAIDTRFFCPPDRLRISVPRRSARPTVFSTRSVFCSTSSAVVSAGSRSWAEYRRASATGRPSWKITSCGTYPIRPLSESKRAYRSSPP